ncbi:hypothetical protein B9G69_010125 [Bdellovibrio sp. SKB1291214]|uniref:hypothetical protein n=1 Tax=Bdellovibrio sp. SKB1291214 TaxID=1732569 RepID=UPI000B51CC27|nr:hypothetical protein [Bdellovibrio sp. SKB1291214]UYL07401.1 hypothetical protein B9G69_010125 [Bdellovibrio sp. SKB1291214]
MSIFKNLFAMMVLLGAILFAFFFKLNLPFSGNQKIESFEYGKRTKEESLLAFKCFGFTNKCELEKIGLTLVMSFDGARIKKPNPNFLNISGWGDRDGWSMIMHYFGHRELAVIDRQGKEIAKFRQLLWNTSGYSDFSQTIAFDLAAKKLYVSNSNIGFHSALEKAYVVPF